VQREAVPLPAEEEGLDEESFVVKPAIASRGRVRDRLEHESGFDGEVLAQSDRERRLDFEVLVAGRRIEVAVGSKLDQDLAAKVGKGREIQK